MLPSRTLCFVCVVARSSLGNEEPLARFPSTASSTETPQRKPDKVLAAMRRPTILRGLTAAILAVATAAGVEFVARSGLRLLEARGAGYRAIDADDLSAAHRSVLADLLAERPSLFQHDAALGWTLRPGFRNQLCTIDAEGRRRDSQRPRPIAPALRVATFGDSFTFGGDVVDRYAYPEVLARLAAGLEVANYGVPAYGLDQAFLRYQREGRAWHPRVVVIGFMSENIFRTVSVFRPFYVPSTLVPLAKPRYLAGEPEPRLLANPLPRLDDYRRLLERPSETLAELGRNDFYYRTRPRAGPLDRSATVRLVKLARERWGPGREIVRNGYYYTAGEAFRVTADLIKAFYEMALRDGAQPVILIFPEGSDLARWRSERTKRYAPLLQFLTAKGYWVVDAMAALETAGSGRPVAELIPAHLSPLGNQLVAEYLLKQLRGFGLVPSSL